MPISQRTLNLLPARVKRELSKPMQVHDSNLDTFTCYHDDLDALQLSYDETILFCLACGSRYYLESAMIEPTPVKPWRQNPNARVLGLV